MGVSENSGTSKSSHFTRVFHYFHHLFSGKTPPIFGNTQVPKKSADGDAGIWLLLLRPVKVDGSWVKWPGIQRFFRPRRRDKLKTFLGFFLPWGEFFSPRNLGKQVFIFLPWVNWVVKLQTFVIFTPKLGEDEPMLTHIFQMGWFNHQPDLKMYGWWKKSCTSRLIWQISHYLQGFVHPRWSKIINSISY